MTRSTVVLLALLLLVAGCASAQTVSVSQSGSRPIQLAPSAHFTGVARVEMLLAPDGVSHLSGGSVTFEPGARTAWHSHPRGQTLIVTSGTGRVQSWGGSIQEIRTGDVVRIPPGVKHWHGAAPTTTMAHIAISEQLDGRTVEWMEPVTDAQYGASGR